MGVFQYYQLKFWEAILVILSRVFHSHIGLFLSYHFIKGGFSLWRPSWVYNIQLFIDLHFNHIQWISFKYFDLHVYLSIFLIIFVESTIHVHFNSNPSYNIKYMFIFIQSNSLTIVNKYKTSLIVMSWKLCI